MSDEPKPAPQAPKASGARGASAPPTKRLTPKTNSARKGRGASPSRLAGSGDSASPTSDRVPVGATTRKLSDLVHPDLLDDLPRANLTKTKLRYTICALLVLGMTTLGLMSQQPTLIPGIVGLLLAGTYALFTWGDSRAFMQTHGDELTVRYILRTHRVRGADVSRVQYLFNGKYPDFRLITKDGTKIQVPASRVDGGHTTLFAWLVVYAPEAIWDRRSVLFLQSMDEKRAL